MNKSEQINELVSALIKAQSEFKPLNKDSVNPFYKSKYATLDSVIESTGEALRNNGLVIIQTMDGDNLVTTLAHTSGQWMSGSYPLSAIKKDPQGMGSAMTYARRYNYSAIIGQAPSEDDDDGNSHVKTQSKTPIKTPIKTPNTEWITRLKEFEKSLPEQVLEHVKSLSDKERAEYYSANGKDVDRIVEAVNKEQEDNNVPPFEGEEVKLEDVPEVDFGNTDALTGGK